MTKNSPITPNGVINVNKIFGPDLSGLRGKTVKREPARVEPEYVKLRWEIVEQNKMVMLMMCFMFVPIHYYIQPWGQLNNS